MGFGSWMRGLLGGAPTPVRATRPGAPALSSASGHRPAPPPALPRHHDTGARAVLPRPTGVGNLDQTRIMTVVLESPQEELVWKLSRRIDSGRFQVPQLPTTALSALELAGRPSAEVGAIVHLITTDPLLSSELLKLANSALFATSVPADTLHQAVMRVGLRSLRGLIFSASMRGVLFKGRVLSDYAEEVWRQALSVAGVARAIARPLGHDPEQAYLLGLLHDIGKVALLSLLREEVRSGVDMAPALVGQVFHSLHEKSGAAMAAAWKLPAELRSVAGCHHDLAENRDHPRHAALALLAHQIDLRFSLGDEAGLAGLVAHPAFDVLGTSDEARHAALRAARSLLESAVELQGARA